MKTFFKQVTCVIFLSLFVNFNTYGMIEKNTAPDFQIYQFLLFATQNTDFLYLPLELVQIIAINTSKVTEQKYGTCLHSVDALLNFIKNKAEASIDIRFTVDILKTCLQYSGKSLYTIRSTLNETSCTRKSVVSCTALHEAIGKSSFVESLKKTENLYYCIDVLCQSVGKDLIDFLCVQDSHRFIALHHAVWFARVDVVEKLIAIAGENASKLTSIESCSGTPLALAKNRYEHLASFDQLSEEDLIKLERYQLIIKILEQHTQKI